MHHSRAYADTSEEVYRSLGSMSLESNDIRRPEPELNTGHDELKRSTQDTTMPPRSWFE